MKLSFATNCGEEIDAKAEICPNCGVSVKASTIGTKKFGIGSIGAALISFGSLFGAVIAAPILGIVGIFIGGLILHICFKIVGGSGSYEGTVRTVSYASAISVVSWIPLVGWILGLYVIYLNIVGGTFVHNLTMGKSAIAVFIPIIILTILGVLLFAMVAALIASIGLGGLCNL